MSFALFCVGKKLFGRSQIRTVAEKRKEKIDLYCRVSCGDNHTLLIAVMFTLSCLLVQTLVRLPPKISEDSFILDFFEVRDTDINKPA